MCGIVGVVSKSRNGFTKRQIEAFQTLLFVDTLRGDDSTGVFCVDNIGNVIAAKEASTAENFLSNPQSKPVFDAAFQRGFALVGHNRKATRGDVVDKNAHPFIADDKIILVHNGTFFGDHKHHKNTEVDSEALAHVIANSTDLAKSFQAVDAAYSTAWYNIETKTLNWFRNGHRPMWTVECEQEILFASEVSFLWLAVERCGLKLVKDVEYCELPEHTLLSFTLDPKNGFNVGKEELDAEFRRPATTFQSETGWKRGGHGWYKAYGYEYDPDHADSCGVEPPAPEKSNRRSHRSVGASNVTPIRKETLEHMDWVAYSDRFTKIDGINSDECVGNLTEYEAHKKSFEGKTFNVIVEGWNMLKVDRTGMCPIVCYGHTADSPYVPIAFEVTDEMYQEQIQGRQMPRIFNVRMLSSYFKKLPDTVGELGEAIGIPFFSCHDPVVVLTQVYDAATNSIVTAH